VQQGNINILESRKLQTASNNCRLSYLSALPVTLRNDLKYGATALLTIECSVSYGDPSLKFISRSCAENVLSASTTGPRLMITTLHTYTRPHAVTHGRELLAILKHDTARTPQPFHCFWQPVTHCLAHKRFNTLNKNISYSAAVILMYMEHSIPRLSLNSPVNVHCN